MVASVAFPASEAGRVELLCCISTEFLRLHGASTSQTVSVEALLKPDAEGILGGTVVECVDLEPRGTGLGLRLSPAESGNFVFLEGLMAKPLP